LSGDSNWLDCERTRSALTRLDAALRDAVAAEEPQLRAMALHLIARGGKRLRPALLFLGAAFGRPAEESLLGVAAALELLHVASLYHDDVIDRALIRRSGLSANARWGNAAAAVAGTYLFARASALLASLGDLPNRLASQASVDLCAGQLQEVENAYNLELTEEEHLEILGRKTATLFELPCRLGAGLTGAAPAHSHALATYGRHLGLAFQLADDALDLVGQASELGKAMGTDLREGVYSLPVLRALRQEGAGGAPLRALLGQTRLRETEVRAARQLVRRSGAVGEALALAREYAGRAQAGLAALPDGPARRSLFRLADYAVSRRR
jgi:geranylgeranyl pyrophosphate synthase